jgi:hypothetical protein
MSHRKSTVDPEMAEFEAALLLSIDQAKRGQGRVTTSEQMMARRPGRPAGFPGNGTPLCDT